MLMGRAVSPSITSSAQIPAHRLAWDLYKALERGRDRRANQLLERMMGKGISQAADIFLEPWRTTDGLAELRREIEAAQGPPPS